MLAPDLATLRAAGAGSTRGQPMRPRGRQPAYSPALQRLKAVQTPTSALLPRTPAQLPAQYDELSCSGCWPVCGAPRAVRRPRRHAESASVKHLHRHHTRLDLGDSGCAVPNSREAAYTAGAATPHPASPLATWPWIVAGAPHAWEPGWRLPVLSLSTAMHPCLCRTALATSWPRVAHLDDGDWLLGMVPEHLESRGLAAPA